MNARNDRAYPMIKQIITLTTDFGTRDGFVGVMHGIILGKAPHVHIIDLTHKIPAHDVRAASFLLQAHTPFFPKQTIHVAVVDPGVGSDRAVLLAELHGSYFLAPDNGLLSFLIDQPNVNFYRAQKKEYWLPQVSQTFHGRDIFAPLAAQLANGCDVNEIFTEVAKNEIVPLEKISVTKSPNSVRGLFVHYDRFGNLITNIRREDLHADKEFIIQFGNTKLYGLSSSYAEKKRGELLAIFNSFSLLEIAVNQGRAVEFFPNYSELEITLSW
ncbi:SAM-dependent chlorinase/fluorinase [candidate division KSB1 bacterium]|nr:SAM-dependent chlorinase/fluorinase [candidate division KSB1 bacterium]